MAPHLDPERDMPTANETTPLLQPPASEIANLEPNGTAIPHGANGHSKDEVDGPEDEANEQEEGERPMPLFQILCLCYISLAEPVAYFAIFPFMPEMTERTGVPQAEVGFWTGFIESSFSIVQMILMIFYGRASDRFGRKPILVFSLAGISIFTSLFGMSRTLWQMILIRCMSGLFAGSVVTVRTMISENCTKKSQARAFSWYMFMSNLGIFIGPLIGGGLANPAENFSSLAKVSFFNDYPYALATFGAGFVCLTATLTALFGLEETLKPLETGKDAQADAPLSTWEVLKSPGMPVVLHIYGHIKLLGLAYTAVSPVFLYTDVDKGGFQFSDQKIALWTAGAGASQALWMLLAFPALQKRFGTGNVLRGCAVGWPVMFVTFPLFNEVLRKHLMTVFWIFAPMQLVLGSGIAMSFACVQLTLNDISPSSHVLGTANALGLTVNSAVRAFAPIAFTSLYAVGVKWGWADGHLIWMVLAVLALSLFIPIYYLPAAAEGRYYKPAARDEEE